MNTKRFIVGVDSSTESRRATTEAIELAKLVGAEVTLLHAVSVEFGDMDSFAKEMAQLSREEGDRADAALKELSHQFVKQGAVVSYFTKRGYPDDVLCAAVVEQKAELCVVGSHGYTGIERFLLGSVAEKVVRSCPTSVLVSRRSQEVRGGYKRILVATDFTEIAEKALATAMELAAHGAQVDLVHCWQIPAMSASYYTPIAVQEQFVAPIRLAVREEVDTTGVALVDKYRRGGVDLRFEGLEGRPVNTLMERLEEQPYDLIALGSHGRRGLRRLILGSVAEKIMRHARCSTLICH